MRSGFFNSEIIGYDAENMPIFDRAEEASFFAKYFNQFIGNGVLQVLATEGMQVKVDIGTCFIEGYLGWAETAETFEIEESDTQPRIDRIVARLDFTDRSIKLFVKKGTSLGNPVAPEVQRDYDIYEIALADVKVNANVVEITQENITDLRLNSELCGVVACLVEQLDTTTLFNQYQSWLTRVTGEAENDLTKMKTNFTNDFTKWFEATQTAYTEWFKPKETEFNEWEDNQKKFFDEWFETIKDKLSGDVAANLTNKVNEIEKKLPSEEDKEKWNKATDDYLKLNNKPRINDVELKDNLSFEDLRLDEEYKPIYIKNYTLKQQNWTTNDDNGGFQYVIEKQGITDKYRTNVYMDTENQAKLSSGYTDTQTDYIYIYTTEEPTEDVTVNLEISLTKEGQIPTK